MTLITKRFAGQMNSYCLFPPCLPVVGALVVCVIGAFTLLAWSSSRNASFSNVEQPAAGVPHQRLLRVLCFGDSLTFGLLAGGGGQPHPYGPALEDRLSERGIQASVVAVGHSGWTSEMMLRNANDTAVSRGGPGLLAALEGRGLHPNPKVASRVGNSRGSFDAVVLLSGTNDLGHRTPPEVVFQDIIALHELCWRSGVPRTVAVGIPESRFSRQGFGGLGESIIKVNQLLAEWATNKPSAVKYTPCPAGFDDLGEDGLHFSAAGYDKLGAGLAEAAGDFLAGRE